MLPFCHRGPSKSKGTISKLKAYMLFLCLISESKLADCPCKDVMSDENNIEARLKVNNRTLDVINSCAKLVNKYGEWCVNYSGNEGLCCQSCQWLSMYNRKTFQVTHRKHKTI